MSRVFWTIAVVVALACPSAMGADTLIVVDLVNQNPRVGDTVFIPVMLTAEGDSIAGFSMPFLLSRPGLLEFHDDWVVRSAGTLTANWDVADGSTFGMTSATIAALADGNPVDGTPLPLAPGIVNQRLIDLVAFVPCVHDPFGEYNVIVQFNGPANFTDPHGQLMTPVAAHSATISVQPPHLGDIDYSGLPDLADVVWSVNCAFRGNCPGCGKMLADLDCSGEVDVVDVILQINHVFRGGAAPTCW